MHISRLCWQTQKQYVCFIILCTLPTNLCLQKYKDETKQLVSWTESTHSAPDRYHAGGYRRVDQRHCRWHCEIFRPAHVLGAIAAPSRGITQLLAMVYVHWWGRWWAGRVCICSGLAGGLVVAARGWVGGSLQLSMSTYECIFVLQSHGRVVWHKLA